MNCDYKERGKYDYNRFGDFNTAAVARIPSGGGIAFGINMALHQTAVRNYHRKLRNHVLCIDCPDSDRAPVLSLGLDHHYIIITLNGRCSS